MKESLNERQLIERYKVVIGADSAGNLEDKLFEGISEFGQKIGDVELTVSGMARRGMIESLASRAYLRTEQTNFARLLRLYYGFDLEHPGQMMTEREVALELVLPKSTVHDRRHLALNLLKDIVREEISARAAGNQMMSFI